MIADEYAYIGRDNVIQRVLLVDEEELTSIQKAAITRVTVKIGSFCLDTDDGINIAYSDGVVTMTVGLIEDIRKGTYPADITVYDSSAVNGNAWGSFTVFVDDWGVCDADS